MRFSACYIKHGQREEQFFEAPSPDQAPQIARLLFDNLEIVKWQETVLWQRTPLVLIKWVGDGASSLPELALRLREEAERIEKMEQAGMELCRPVEDGVAMMRRPAALDNTQL